MIELLNKIAHSEFFLKLENSKFLASYLEYIYNLNEIEIKILVVITAVLILVFVVRTFSLTIMFVVLFAYLILYVIYQFDIRESYEIIDANKSQRMHEIELQLERNKTNK